MSEEERKTEEKPEDSITAPTPGDEGNAVPKPEESRPGGKKHRLLILALALGLAALLMAAVSVFAPDFEAPAGEKPAAETPAAEETPCPHAHWVEGVCADCGEVCGHPAWENGVCTRCGEVCGHPAWEGGVCTRCGEVCGHPAWEDGVCTRCGEVCGHPAWEDGVCTRCGYVCPHERHDPETAVCLLCGEQRCHSYARGRCVGCGREPKLTELPLPENYYEPAEHQGSVVDERFDYGSGSYMLRLYLPYGYDDSRPYNLAILFHGGNGYIGDTIDTEFYSEGGWLRPCQLYDHMIEDHLCEPFIVASIFTGEFGNQEAEWIGELIHNGLLPYLAEHYSTYAASGSPEDLRAARMHVAMGGHSNGGRFACYSGIARNFDYAANFCCFSAGPDFITRVVIPAVRDYEEKGVGFGVFFDGAGAWEAKKLKTEEAYRELYEGVESLTEGENSFYVEVDHQHGWTSWFACYYNALQLLFPAEETPPEP